MEDSSQGARARLVLTPNALHRHARRAQRELEALGVPRNLTDSQAFFARVLGFKSWHEALQVVEAASRGEALAPLVAPTVQPQASPSGFVWPGEPPRFDGLGFEQFLRFAAEQSFSDLTLTTGQPLIGERFGRRHPMSARPLTTEEIMEIAGVLSGLGDKVQARIQAHGDLDFPAQLRVGGDASLRLRVNLTAIFSEGRPGVQMNLRTMPSLPPRLVDLQLPDVLRNGLFVAQGLVVVAGSTGAGKTTLLGATVRAFIEDPDQPTRKVLTYESPIEYVYDSLVSPNGTQVAQTAIGAQLPSFAAGVRNALRRKPHAILVGEARDAETIGALLEAAMTGHAVYTSMNANGAADVLRRLRHIFPGDERDARWFDLVSVLKTVVVQKLLPTTDGKRVAIREFLVLDEVFVDRLMNQPDQLMRLVRERLDEHGSSFAHDARVKHAQGLIDDRTLAHILSMAKSWTLDA